MSCAALSLAPLSRARVRDGADEADGLAGVADRGGVRHGVHLVGALLLQELLDLGVEVVQFALVANILIGVANVFTLIIAAPLVSAPAAVRRR